MAPDPVRLWDTATRRLRELTRGSPGMVSDVRVNDQALVSTPLSADHRPILIYGFHRGGTTYLQRLLNCTPEVCIWGEHAGVLSDYRRAYMRFAAAPVSATPGEAPSVALRNPRKWSPWVSKHSVDSYAALLRTHILSLFSVGDGRTRWGFKEIKYEDPADAAFMLQLFPDARIVLLTRNAVDLFLSQYFVKWNREWRKQGLDACAREFTRLYRRRIEAFEAIAASSPNARIVNLESFRETSESFERLINFLDLSVRRFDHKALAVANEALVGSSFANMGIEAAPEEVAAVRAWIQQALTEAEVAGSGSA